MTQNAFQILAGDIGGTNSRLALFEAESDGKKDVIRRTDFPSQEFQGLESIVNEFLQKQGEKPDAACFGIAGPVFDQRAETSNLPWTVDAKSIARNMNIPKVLLLNDLEAASHGIDELSPDDLATINEGKRKTGNRALISAGTGLGEALAIWNGTHYISSASEGGHADFAPTSLLEVELHKSLAKEFGHVSWERVTSGQGIHNIYNFLRTKSKEPEEPGLSERIDSDEPAKVIVEFAGEGGDAVCRDTVKLFVHMFGREAGNHALKTFALGGVYIGGGIAPNILEFLECGSFMEAFTSKGRMSDMLRGIPVQVILDEDVGLLGAARLAFHVAAKREAGK